jgi:hypothetical protein
MNTSNRFRRSGAGVSRKAQAMRDAPPIIRLVMAEILARKFHADRAARPSIVNALFERAADEANARLFGRDTSRPASDRMT